ncbi:MAG: PhnD/SsuA/transferrin family substrate-binding protein [Xanthomonadales bacterium]|nr:PhnD/SsuA/transferrin family substrate-binding protein [Xanthomonadales bacterium]
MSRFRCIGLILGLLTTGLVHAETYNLVVQPIYTPERAREVYAPLTDYLNRATSHTFNLVTPKNFHHYWADMRRRDDWHLIFDDAHFTDYRVQKFDYTPLVKTAEQASFSLLAGPMLMETELDTLVGRRIVTMPAPSLGFSLLTEWFSNPLQQPIIVSSAFTWRDTVEIVFAGEAEAAMVPTWLAQRYPNLLPIRESRQLPGEAISASAAVDDAAREEITAALLKLHEDESLYEVLVELNISQFEPATEAEYAGHADLLKSFYGY